jgi:cell division protein ZipA
MDKTQLQLILIGAGAVIIALIYFWGKYTERKERDQRQRVAGRSPEEPIMNFDPSAAEIDTAERRLQDTENAAPAPPDVSQPSVDVEIMPIRPSREPSVFDKEQQETQADLQHKDNASDLKPNPSHATPESESVLPQESKMTVILMIMAGSGKMFQGSSILLAVQEQKLKLREGIFECFLDGKEQGKSLFGVGHLLEPGTFELETINNLSTPGLIIFMQLPGPLEPVQATNRLVAAAKTLANKLGGSVCDERRNKISAQGFSKMESDAAEFQRQLRLQNS